MNVQLLSFKHEVFYLVRHILQASSHIYPVIVEVYSYLHDLNSKWR